MKKFTSICLTLFLLLNNLCCVSLAEFNPELLWYEDFDYGVSSDTAIGSVSDATDADELRGFADGWSSSSDIASVGYSVFNEDENTGIKATKFSTNPMQRTLAEGNEIDFDTSGLIYYIGWEQYFNENVQLNDNGSTIILKSSDSADTITAGIGNKDENGKNLLKLQTYIGSNTKKAWGEAQFEYPSGETYKCVLRIETHNGQNGDISNDRVKLKIYPKEDISPEGWDGLNDVAGTPVMVTNSAITGKFNILEISSRAVVVRDSENNITSSSDIRFSDIWAAQINAEDIADIEAAIGDVSAKLLLAESADDEIEIAEEKLDVITEPHIREDFSNFETLLEEFAELNEVAKLVEKAKETASNEDIDDAQDAVDNLGASDFKDAFQDGIDDAITIRDARQVIIESVEAAEAAKTLQAVNEAKEMVEMLSEGSSLKEELTERLNAVIAEIDVIAFENAESITQAEYNAMLESIENLSNGSKKTELLDRLQALTDKIITYEAAPQLLWNEDFDYSLMEEKPISNVPGALAEDSEKGFATGWTRDDGTAIGGTDWSIFNGESLKSALKAIKFSSVSIKRAVKEGMGIDLDEEGAVYTISWEQYFDEDVLLRDTGSSIALKSAADSSMAVVAGIGLENERNLLRLQLGNSLPAWGGETYEFPCGETYKLLLRIEAHAEGTDDVIKVKAYPAEESGTIDWLISASADLSGNFDVLGIRSSAVAVSDGNGGYSTSNDIRFSDIWAEKLAGTGAEYAQNIENDIASLREKLLKAESADSDISSLEEKLEEVSESKLKTYYTSTLESYEAINEVAKKVAKAKETEEDVDISDAQNATSAVNGTEFKAAFEKIIEGVITLKTNRQAAIDSVASAEAEKTVQKAAEAKVLVNALPEGSTKENLVKRLAAVWIDIAKASPTEENVEEAFNAVCSLPESGEKQALMGDFLGIKVALLENQASIMESDYTAVLESIESLPSSSKKTELLGRLEAIQHKVKVFTVSPSVLWNENFDYSLNEEKPINEVSAALQAEVEKGFSTGWYLVKDDAPITADVGWNISDKLKATKFNTSAIKRMISEEKRVNLDKEGGIYTIGWEQYFDENALKSDNNAMLLTFRTEDSNTNSYELFKAGIRVSSGTHLPRLNWNCGFAADVWEPSTNVRSGGIIYQIIMQIETQPEGAKDIVKLKIYPKGGFPEETWDLETETDINGKLDMVQIESSNSNVEGASKDVFFANIWGEEITSADKAYIEETEILLKSIREKLLLGEEIDSLIAQAEARLDEIAQSGTKTVLVNIVKNCKTYSNAAKLVAKAGETESDEDILNAESAINIITDTALKNMYGSALEDIKALKLKKQEAAESVTRAEVEKSAEKATLAKEKVKLLPDCNLKTELTARVAAIWAEIANNEPTGENLTEALDAVNSLPASSEKYELLTPLLESKINSLENEAYPGKEDYDVAIKSVESLPESAKKAELSERMKEVKNEVAKTYAPEAVEQAETERTQASLDEAREWVELLPDSEEKTSLTQRLDTLKDGMEIFLAGCSFDYEAGISLADIKELNSADPARGWGTGWMTGTDLLTPINSNGVKTDGNGFILFPATKNIWSGMYRGLTNPIDLTKSDEYYLACKIRIPADASTDTNRSLKFELNTKDAAEPLFAAGLVGNGSYLTFFVKDNNRVDYTKRSFGTGKTFNLKMRITSGEDISDRIYVKLWYDGTEEPSDWMITKATSIDTVIDILNFNSNDGATYGFADIMVEQYTEDKLTKLYAAESAVTTATYVKTEESTKSARALIDLLPDSLAKSDLLSKLQPVEVLIEKQKAVEEVLKEAENAAIDSSNVDSIESLLDGIVEDVKALEETKMAVYSDRIEAVKARIYKAQAERDITVTGEWKGNKELTEEVNESLEQVERFASVSPVKSEEENNYYIKLNVTPSSSESKISIGNTVIEIDSLAPNVPNTVILAISKDSVTKYVGKADKNGNLIFAESSEEITIPAASVLGITLKKGSSSENATVQKVNASYAELLGNELAALKLDSKLSDIENAKKKADSFAEGILKDLLQEKINAATVNNISVVPEIDIVTIGGINQVGQTLTANVTVIDKGGNFKEYKYEWLVGGRVVSEGSTISVSSSMGGKTMTLKVTPYSIHNKAGKSGSVTAKILPGASNELGSGSTGGGGGGGGGGKPSAPQSGASTAGEGFVDLRNHWAKADVEYMAEKGYVTGTSKDFFAPDNKITRGEFATLIARILGLEAVTTDDFTDVAQNSWYNGYIGAVLKAGVLSGYGNGLFKPDENVTREEMAKGIMNAYTYLGKSMEIAEEAQFTDAAQISPWAAGYVKSCYKLGIMMGDVSGNFRPRDNATRAEAAVVLKRVITSK